MESRYDRPEVVVLTLENGDTLTVRKRLTAGESREAYARRFTVGADGVSRVNLARVEVTKISAYLVDWTVKGLDGSIVKILREPIDVVEASLLAQHDDSFNEIYAAILEHEKAMHAARAAEKKTIPTGAPVLSAISTSAA